jgi:hypothetical protein
MTTKKYEILQGQTLEHEGRTLYRIRRLSDGLIGGWIEKEANLSHEGGCFVYDEAKVYENARVFEHSCVFDHAEVYDTAWVCGYAEVYGMARVFGDAQVYGASEVYDYAKVFGNAKVLGSAEVGGNARLFDDATATKKVIWKEMPRHHITASDHHIAIGCECHTLDHWREHIEEIGKKNRYSNKEIALYRKTIFGKDQGAIMKFIMRRLNGFPRIAWEKLKHITKVVSLVLLIFLPLFCIVGLPPTILFWLGIGCLPILLSEEAP